MNSKSSHGYHGLTQKPDKQGFLIQLNLLGRYRQFSAETYNAETAARRHDIALYKLEAFLDKHAHPNFPDDFSKVTCSPEASSEPAHHKFLSIINDLFRELHEEAERMNLDPDDLLRERNGERERMISLRTIATTQERAKFQADLAKLVFRVRKLKTDKANEDRLTRGLTHVLNVYEEIFNDKAPRAS